MPQSLEVFKNPSFTKKQTETFTVTLSVFFLQRVVFDQVSHCFSVISLNSDFQHAYNEGLSTSTALTQMTDQWLSDIDRNRMVLLDFSAAVDHHSR